MYNDVITVFNRYENSSGVFWYPSVLENVNVNIDKGYVLRQYGADSQDNAILNVKYRISNGEKFVGEKKWLPPKQWDAQTNDLLSETITFYGGNDFDFFWMGEWEGKEPISDDDYNGFFNYMSKKHDYVFRITNVSILSVIPHFEITGR
jgi:hypothetical protein